MRRILLIAILIVGITAAYGYAQMDQGHMSQGMMDSPGYGESKDYDKSQNPTMGQGMMGQGGQGMMGQGGYGMMGQGQMGGMMGGMMGPGMMGYGGQGMMGQGHMGGMMGSGGQGMMGQGRMGGMMGSGGYGMRQFSPEEYKKYQEDYRKYLDDTMGIRKKLHNKKFDYYEAIRKPDTKRGTIMKIEKEMLDLQWELYEKAPR